MTLYLSQDKSQDLAERFNITPEPPDHILEGASYGLGDGGRYFNEKQCEAMFGFAPDPDKIFRIETTATEYVPPPEKPRTCWFDFKGERIAACEMSNGGLLRVITKAFRCTFTREFLADNDVEIHWFD